MLHEISVLGHFVLNCPRKAALCVCVCVCVLCDNATKRVALRLLTLQPALLQMIQVALEKQASLTLLSVKSNEDTFLDKISQVSVLAVAIRMLDY